ncbi:MAG: hypothetical protein ACFE0R_16470 [Salinarimonas sp.]
MMPPDDDRPFYPVQPNSRTGALREDAPGLADIGVQLAARLAHLHALGAQDGIAVEPESEAAPTAFLQRAASDGLDMHERAVRARPAIALLDSGELRVLWTSDLGQVGLRFGADGRIGYVCLATRQGARAHASGTDAPERAMRVVEAMGLASSLHRRVNSNAISSATSAPPASSISMPRRADVRANCHSGSPVHEA